MPVYPIRQPEFRIPFNIHFATPSVGNARVSLLASIVMCTLSFLWFLPQHDSQLLFHFIFEMFEGGRSGSSTVLGLHRREAVDLTVGGLHSSIEHWAADQFLDCPRLKSHEKHDENVTEDIQPAGAT
jgi:hypothetical protein